MGWPWRDEDTLQEQQELAWRSAVTAAVVVIVLQGAFTLITWRLYGWSLFPMTRLAHVGLAVVILVTLLLSSPARRRLGVTAFYILSFAGLPTLWMADAERLAADVLFVPLSAYKLVLLLIAVVAPGAPALGLTLLGAIVAQGVVQVMVSDYSGLPGAGAEPWATMAYGGAAAVILLYRAHHRRVARRAARAAAEASTLSELTRFMLAVRDLYNTPIQNLEIDTALLERNHPPTPNAIRRMRTAVRQLRELRSLLTRYDHLAEWDPEQHALDSERAQEWLERLEATAQGRDRNTAR